MVIVKVYSKDGLIPLQVEDDKCYCTHEYDGSDTLSFEVQRKDGNHKYIKEEVIVECFNNRFIIKKIDEHSDFSSIACELDLDDWKYDIYKNYRKTRYTIINAVDSIIPDGWSAVYSDAVNVTKRTTLEESDGQAFRIATALEILAKAAETYEVVFNYDCIGKILYVENPSSFTSSGDYFMEDLNISITGFNGDSSGFATRVYAYGNQDDDGNFVTFADINNGKEYIEDFTYSDKIISTYIIDERYTVKEHLLEYAKSVLKEKSAPSRSYQCENIKNIDGTMYLYKVVTLIDKDRRMQVEHQCVQYIEYNNHNLDSITLSMTQPQITSSIQSANSTASKAQSTANSVSGTVSEIKTVIDELPDIYVTKFELEEVVDELPDIIENTILNTDFPSLNTEHKDLPSAINELFTSVSNGKELIASAITDKGVETDANAKFATMAENIGKIDGGSSGGCISVPINLNQYADTYTYISEVVGSMYRYLKLSSNGSTANTSNHYVEVQAFDDNGVNVALGKTSNVATDGVYNNPSAYIDLGAGNQILTIDLGSIYKLDYIKVWRYYGDGRTYHDVVVSASIDGVDYDVLFDSNVDGEYAETPNGKTIYIN